MMADIVINTETAAAMSGLLLAITGALGFIFKLLMGAKERQIIRAEAEVEVWKQMARDAVENLESAVAKFLDDNDPKKKLPKLAEIVAEHQSPTKPEAQKLADFQTMRARQTAAALALGIPPRLPGTVQVATTIESMRARLLGISL